MKGNHIPQIRVLKRIFEYNRQTAIGEILVKAEENKNREFQFWAEKTFSL